MALGAAAANPDLDIKIVPVGNYTHTLAMRILREYQHIL